MSTSTSTLTRSFARSFALLLFASAIAVAQLPADFTYGVLVSTPVSTGSTLAPLNNGLTFMAIAGFPPQSALLATAQLPSGPAVLANGLMCTPQLFASRGVRGCRSYAWSLTGGDGQPASLPTGTPVNVTITTPSGDSYSISTGNLLRGVVQSADLRSITLSTTNGFDANSRTGVYFGYWPFAVRSEAITVTVGQIVVDLSQEPLTTALIGSGNYPVTVVNGSICDSVMLSFQWAGNK